MTLTDTQIKTVLAAAMAYDNRKLPGEANRAAWGEAARRANWTLAGAIEAVHQHYATSTDFVMPGHITALIRAERRQPAPFQPAPPRPQLPPGVDVRALPDIDAATADVAPVQARPGRPNPLSRWSTRKARRDPLEGDLRKRIQAELDAKRPREAAEEIAEREARGEPSP